MMNTNGNIKRYIWIDMLKIIACFCVINNHTIGFLLDFSGYNKISTLIYSIFFSMCKIGVPIFIMCTGYLSQNKENTYSKAINKIFRIIIPLLAISLLLFLKDNGIKNFNILDFTNRIISEPIITPLWYLYMLIGLYLVEPFIKKMTKNFVLKDYKYFMILFLIIPGLINTIKLFFNIKISYYFTLAFFAPAIGLYVSGIYLSKIKLNKNIIKSLFLIYIISTIIFIIQMYSSYIYKNEVSYALDSWNSLVAIIPAMSLFCIIRYFFEEKKSKDNYIKIITNISNVTFGIYLFHPLINYKIYKMFVSLNIFKLNYVVGIILVELMCFIICGIVTYILRKIKLFRKFL